MWHELYRGPELLMMMSTADVGTLDQLSHPVLYLKVLYILQRKCDSKSLSVAAIFKRQITEGLPNAL